jgi:hypothetical protein
MSEIHACACGWRKPLFEITTPNGDVPPELVVFVHCPCCGEPYSPSEAGAIARFEKAVGRKVLEVLGDKTRRDRPS